MRIDPETKKKIATTGFTVINNVFTEKEIDALVNTISKVDSSGQTFRKSTELFAIRQFLKEVPDAANIVFNEQLKCIILSIFEEGFFVVKSIYFDKPPASNWFVAWHQDLTISVDQKMELDGYRSWTTKHQQFAVQPPLPVLEDNFTIRIHLDDTNEENGALKIIPSSHLKGIYRPETIDWSSENEITVNVQKGGVMLMKPLLLHSSGRTTNHVARRVIHIEFSRITLPNDLHWSEKTEIPNSCQPS
ncbi:MAG: phytanoyl-CoA dioxygenase family protein [Bacteroidota bacterium]